MKKKILIAIVLLAIFGLAAWGGYYGYQAYQKQQAWEAGTRPFNTLTKIQKVVSPVNEAPTDFNKRTIVILFNSECDHCQAEADILSERMDELRDIQLWFISFEESEQALAFLNEKGLTRHPDYHLFSTNPEEAKAMFGVLWLPQTFLYEENQLTKGFLGPIKFDEQIGPFL